jgi:ABC-type multidrug transport system permease subunit
VAATYHRDREIEMEFVIGGILYFILLVTLGIITIRKGHWVMFIIGIFIPLFWIIGALMPARQPA